MYTVVQRTPFFIITVVSKKLTDVFEYSCVNFIEGCILLSLDMNSSKESSSCVQMENMSSIKRQKTRGLNDFILLFGFVSYP